MQWETVTHKFTADEATAGRRTMNAQRDFNVLDLRPDLGERFTASGAYEWNGRRPRINPGVKGALGVLIAQMLIVAAGALFWAATGLRLAA